MKKKFHLARVAMMTLLVLLITMAQTSRAVTPDDPNGVLTARPPHTDGSSATSPKNPARCGVFLFALFRKKSFFYNICNIL